MAQLEDPVSIWRLEGCPVSCFGCSVADYAAGRWKALPNLASAQILKEATLFQLCILHFIAPAAYLPFSILNNDHIKNSTKECGCTRGIAARIF